MAAFSEGDKVYTIDTILQYPHQERLNNPSRLIRWIKAGDELEINRSHLIFFSLSLGSLNKLYGTPLSVEYIQEMKQAEIRLQKKGMFSKVIGYIR